MALVPIAMLAACNPPAADHYVARVGVSERDAPSPPIDTPDTKGAVWAAVSANRLLYGKPGQPPLFALECRVESGQPLLTYTRFAAADARAKAVLALIGNGHVNRLKVDATRKGEAWFWQGSDAAWSPDFEGFTGGRQVEATVPGAGSLILNPSPLPGELVTRCRSLAPPAAPASAPGAVDGALQNRPGTIDTAEPPLSLEQSETE